MSALFAILFQGLMAANNQPGALDKEQVTFSCSF